MTTLGFSAGRWGRGVLALLGRLVLAAGLAGPALAQDIDAPGRVGRIAEIQGTVWRYDADQGEWVAATRNRPVTTGDRLSTERGSRAEVQIGSTTLRLDGDTDLEMRELDDEQVRIYLRSGDIALRPRSSDVAREYAVETDAGRFLPTSAGHMRIERDGPSVFGTVWSGSMRFDANDSALDLAAGQRAEFWNDNGVTHYTWVTAPSDGFAQWALAQDREDQRNLQRYGDISPEMTGVDDLDRYGRWDTHPEYGAIWAPTAVGAGWAPYRDGHWAYVRPWGWTWVDDAPWGFAPFHYGRWVEYRGRWHWAPGRYAARPVYAPALVGWVGGSGVSVGVTIGSRPSLPPYVGWVPLAPHERYVPGYRVGRHRDFDPYYGPGRRPQGWRAPEHGTRVRYTNEGLPGGVTVVPSDVLRERRPISGRLVSDPRIVRGVTGERRTTAPPPPPVRVVAVPGGAVPLSPAWRGREDRAPRSIGGPRADAERGQGPSREADEQRRERQRDRDAFQRPGTPPPAAGVMPGARHGRDERDDDRQPTPAAPRGDDRAPTQATPRGDAHRGGDRPGRAEPRERPENRVQPAVPRGDAYRGGDRPPVQAEPRERPEVRVQPVVPRDAFRGGDRSPAHAEPRERPPEVRVQPVAPRDAYRGGDRPQVPPAASPEANRGGGWARERDRDGDRGHERQAPRVAPPAPQPAMAPPPRAPEPPRPAVQPAAPRGNEPAPPQRERGSERQNMRERQQER